MKEDEEGWHDIGARQRWFCPECKKWSATAEWEELSVPCDLCGDHEGRGCPECGERFDHVWGSDRIERESEKAEKRNEK